MKKPARFEFVLALTVVLGGLIGAAIPVPAQQRHRWEFKGCFTDRCVTDFLNTLPPEAAASAKVSYNPHALTEFYKIFYVK